MQCALCGYEFDTTQLTCHTQCPLSAGCAVICCPRCGYATVDPARAQTARWFTRLLRPHARRLAVPGAVALLDLTPGQGGLLVTIASDTPERLHQLTQYGLTPGIPVRLRQKRPMPIVQIGETDLALDTEIAAAIFVEPDSEVVQAPHSLSAQPIDNG